MQKVFTFPVTQVKRMESPVIELERKPVTRYVCYVKLNDVPAGFRDWMQTNPRDQKLTTNVAKEIKGSITNGRKNFHDINRGIVMSVDKFKYDNETKLATVTMEDLHKHGNIDGGHTLRIILEQKASGGLMFEQYVFFEFFTGIDSPAELAEARNTSVQVDQRSIEELNNSFAAIKEAIENCEFESRVAYRQNQHEDEKNTIDIREVIAIINMFNQSIFPIEKEVQPIQSYTGKETSLNKYLNLGPSRDQIIRNMSPIIPGIFDLWNKIETDLPEKGKAANRIYKRKKYAKFGDGNTVSNAMISNAELDYVVPKGIMYPIVGAFRALIKINEATSKYEWVMDPINVWEKLGPKLVSTIMTSSEDLSDSPDAIGKSPNTWDILFKEVLIHSMLKRRP
jgi:hypothetical protein